MKLHPLCAPCNLGSIVELMDILDIRENRWAMTQKLMKVASNVPEDTKPIELYKILYDVITEGKVIDIYKEKKQIMNQSVLDIYDWLQDTVRKATNPIKHALKLSVIGNIIDIGVYGHSWGNLKEEITKHLNTPFFLDERDIFLEKLNSAKSIFLIGDNAGEIVFDKLLLETIHKFYPHIDIKVGVRGSPLLNDITYEDAAYAGIPEDWIVDTGVNLPGFLPKAANETALRLLKSSDIIISKGQGNFEGLSELASDKLFFALKAKCKPVALQWKTTPGSLIFSRLR